MNFSPGTQIYKYLLKEPLGKGNFGEVWLAHDASIRKDMAVKIMGTENAPALEQLREAQIGNRLDHSNLVKIHYADVVHFGQDEVVIIAMEYLPLGSITNLVNSANYLPLSAGLSTLRDVLRGLENLHEHGYYHGDIKPQNIMIGHDNQSMLGDYGISLEAPKGEEVYMRNSYILHGAPEVFERGKVTRQTDIYQMGITAFRLINGLGTISNKYEKLSKGAFGELVRSGGIITDSEYLPFVPSAVRRIINKAVSVNPRDRYQTALDMRRELEAIHYPGDWDVDASGNYIGTGPSYLYQFEEQLLPGNRSSFTAYKTNKHTGRQTKITKYSALRLTRAKVLGARKRFMQDVLRGIA